MDSSTKPTPYCVNCRGDNRWVKSAPDSNLCQDCLDAGSASAHAYSDPEQYQCPPSSTPLPLAPRTITWASRNHTTINGIRTAGIILAVINYAAGCIVSMCGMAVLHRADISTDGSPSLGWPLIAFGCCLAIWAFILDRAFTWAHAVLQTLSAIADGVVAPNAEAPRP